MKQSPLPHLRRRAVTRPWVQRELLYALRTNRYDGRIVPLVFQPCRLEKLSWTLPGFQVIDFTQDVDEAHRRLLAVWGIEPRPDRQVPRSARRPVNARVHGSR